MGYWVYFPEYRMNVDIINEFLGELFPTTPVEDFRTQLSGDEFKFYVDRPLTTEERNVLMGRRIRNRRR